VFGRGNRLCRRTGGAFPAGGPCDNPERAFYAPGGAIPKAVPPRYPRTPRNRPITVFSLRILLIFISLRPVQRLPTTGRSDSVGKEPAVPRGTAKGLFWRGAWLPGIAGYGTDISGNYSIFRKGSLEGWGVVCDSARKDRRRRPG